MNKQDELLANPPAEAVPPLRFWRMKGELEEIRLVDSQGWRWAVVGDKTEGLYWRSWAGTQNYEALHAKWEEVFPAEPDEPVRVQTFHSIAELQARFSKALANPPKGIDLDDVKPFYDPVDGDVNLVNIAAEPNLLVCWREEADEDWRGLEIEYTPYATGAQDGFIPLQWTVDHYGQGWRDGAAARSAEWQPLLKKAEKAADEATERIVTLARELAESRAAHDAAVEQHGVQMADVLEKNRQLVQSAETAVQVMDASRQEAQELRQKAQLLLDSRNAAWTESAELKARVEAMEHGFKAISAVSKAFR